MTDTVRPTILPTAGSVALAASCLIVVLIAVLSYRDGLAFERASQQREISERTARATAVLLSALRDAETGQSYLLTGRESYLAPYRRAVMDAPEAMSVLVGSAVRPDQGRRVETLKPLVRGKLDELQRTIDLYRSGSANAAIAVVQTDEGKTVMDKIRQICSKIETVANNRAVQQSAEAFAAAQRTRIISSAGSALLLALLILATFTIRRGQAAQALLANIIKSSEDAIVSKNLDSIVMSWNAGAEKIFAYSAAEMIGQPITRIIPPELSAEEAEILARIRKGESITHYETVRLGKAGNRFAASLTVSPLKDAAGRIVGVSKIVRDITDRRQAEQKLQAQLARLDLLNRITRAVGERQDLRSVFQVVIRSLEEQLPIDFGCMCLYDASRESLLVTSIGVNSQALGLELALTEQAQIAVDPNGLARCVRGQLVYEPDIGASEFPFAQRLARGGLRSLVTAPLLLEAEIFGVLIAARRQPESFTSRDCEFLRQLSEHVALAAHQAQVRASLQDAYDDLRQTQQAMVDQERLRALGQMSSGIAHDINNALSPMTLYTESLLEREPNLSAKMRRYLEIAQRSVDDVVHTVARLKEFSPRREVHVTLTPVDLNRLVEQILDLTRARWSDMPQQRGVVIEPRTELAPDLPLIAGIESEIREALTNLVFNAVDAMPQGGILTLRTRADRNERTSLPLNSVHVEVQDTGLGMDEETRRRCLEPFFTTKGERGTGLGLAMVFGIVSRHDAEIDIDSAPGTGTTVRLSFPASTAQTPLVYPAPLSPLRILVVDDDPLILRALKATLEDDGHSVATATGGQEGIEVFRLAEGKERFDAVITDLGMPHVDGHRVASAVKATRPSAPVILLTGWGQRLVEEGEAPPYVDRVLSKPPKRQELRSTLGELIARSNLAGSV